MTVFFVSRSTWILPLLLLLLPHLLLSFRLPKSVQKPQNGMGEFEGSLENFEGLVKVSDTI